MNARLAERTGFALRGGMRVGYEIYGRGDSTLVLIPPSPITHARSWKLQIADLARDHRVVTLDGPGCGRSDRPADAAAYRPESVADAIAAVLDEADVDEAVLVAHCHATYWALLVAAGHPDRVTGLVAISPGIPGLGDSNPNWAEVAEHWLDVPAEPEGFRKCNPAYWLADGYDDWIDFWWNHLAVEPHSTKLVEDLVGWSFDTDAESMILAEESESAGASAQLSEALCRSLQCPTLVIHGTEDRCQMLSRGERVAELTGGTIRRLEGVGHLVPGREPVVVNQEIRRFVDQGQPTPKTHRTWTRALSRRRRALYVSSPIGLGHARRDIAIAEELAELHPELEIEWLAQHPVTAVLEAEGHTVHPASRWLASESAHIASEASDHDLNVFQALRRMDEILLANFMVFQEIVDDGHYDLVIADEAWDIDHFWHENPELKRGAHVWMTDFVGYVPMPEGGEHEAYLTADYNTEMVEHVARFPRIRDRAVFVGNPDDLVSDLLGPDLPTIRDWTLDNFAFSGFVTGFAPPSPAETVAWRSEFGYRPDERVCLVAVGGSGVGRALIDRVAEAYPYARKEIPDLRMIVVAGPRIEPASLSLPEGVEVVGYVEKLHRHLSVCDLAVVQGGLSTTMELTAARRPFLYFPLRNHFEQNRHVRHRLERYRAGRFMDYGTSSPEEIAAAMAEELARTLDYLPVETDGAARAAGLIAELI